MFGLLDDSHGGSVPLCHMGATCVQADKRLVSSSYPTPALSKQRRLSHRVCENCVRWPERINPQHPASTSSPGLALGAFTGNGINFDRHSTGGDVLLGKSKSSPCSPCKESGRSGWFAFGKPRVPALVMLDVLCAVTLNGIMCFAM